MNVPILGLTNLDVDLKRMHQLNNVMFSRDEVHIAYG